MPSYVPKEKSANSYEPNTCYSKIWETTTADNMIRVLQQVASRYKNDPNFLGITMEETFILPTSFAANRDLAYPLYDQLKRTARSVHRSLLPSFSTSR